MLLSQGWKIGNSPASGVRICRAANALAAKIVDLDRKVLEVAVVIAFGLVAMALSRDVVNVAAFASAAPAPGPVLLVACGTGDGPPPVRG